MATILKIKELGLQQLNNAEFAGFMNRFRKLIPVQASEEEERPGGLSVLTESETVYLGVTSEMLAAFDADMQALTDSVSRQRTDDRTKQKSLYEVSRGSCVTLYFTSLQTAMKSPIAATAEAGNILWTRTKDYRGIQRLPQQQETAQIRGLLFDLAKEENQTHVTTLHLEGLLEQMRETNEEFARLSEESLTERAADTTEQTLIVRDRLAVQYDDISTTIFAFSVAEKNADALTFVGNLNALVDETRTAYKRRSKGETESEETPEGGNEEGDNNEERPGGL